MSTQLSLIESAIDVPLMDIKNISKLINEYTIEYCLDENPTAVYFYRDCMRKLYADCKNYIPENGLKSTWIDIKVKRFDDEVAPFYTEMKMFTDMLIETTSNI